MSARASLGLVSKRTRRLFYAGIPGVVGGLLAYVALYFTGPYLPYSLASLEENVLFAVILVGIALEVGAYFSWKADDQSQQQGQKWIP